MRDVLIGQTDYTILVRMTSTAGAPVTGLAHTDIDIAYARVETDNDVTTSDVSPASLSALADAHSDWGWKEVSSTDHPGLYRLDVADAVFASGAWESVVTITDASGTDFYATDIGFRLVSFNVQDGVRMGLTALPNAAADAAGGLPISDAGGLDLDTLLARLDAAISTRQVAIWAAANSTVNLSATTIKTATDLATAIDAVDNFVDTEIAGILTILGTPAGASIAADLVVIDDFVDALEARLTAARAGYLDNINNSNLANVPAFPSNFASLGINASGHISRVTLTDTTTTNTDMITAAGIRAAVGLAAANLDTQLSGLSSDLSDVATDVSDVLVDTGTTLPAQIAALLSTAGSESYRADGATGSVFQLLYEIMALVGEFSISSTTKQHKKIDGSTNAFASTLNDATTPTAITRSLSA